MANFEFSKDKISQHVVKFGVHVRPSLSLKADKTKLLDYCQWLIEEFPEIFETLLSGPNKLMIQKVFVATNGQTIEVPTFGLTQSGPVYTFPVKIPVEEIEDFDVPNKNNIVRKALKKFRLIFPDRGIHRVGAVNEFIYDSGATNSVDIMCDGLSKARWKRGAACVKIRLENPREGLNINVDMVPQVLRQVTVGPGGLPAQRNAGFGISVKLDINNQDMSENLEDRDIANIMTVADDFIDEELYRFLNNEDD